MSDKPDKLIRWKKSVSITILCVFLILFGVLASTSLSAPIHRWADSSSYYMQISSIVEDHDIRYQPVDIQRALQNRFDDLPAGLYLIKNDDGNYFYGKEFSYALFASPFFFLLGNSGILFFNALMFCFMILMGFFYLRKKGNSPLLSLFTAFLFFILSTAVVYIFWIHVEIYNMFLIMAGIFFWSLYTEDPKKDTYFLSAAFIFGLATVAKLPNCLLFLPFLCHEVYNKQFKRSLSILVMFLIPILLFYGFFYFETGSMSFYGGNRLSYMNQYPFIGGFDSINESGQPGFSVEEGRISALVTTDILTKSPFNFFYYFFGRFTGMFWYYPLTGFALLSFVLSLVSLRNHTSEQNTILSTMRQNPLRYLVFIGIILNILFYIIVIGNNYLGGQHAIGNRYFYIFPAFLFLIGKIDLKVIVPFIVIALFTVIPLISDPIDTSRLPEKHTFEVPYTILPVEYSQINNLPLWTHQYTSSDYSIYDIDGKGIFSFDPKYIIINGTSHWIIKTKTKNQNVSFMIFSTDTREKQIVFTSESHSTEIIINGTNARMVALPLSQAVYEDAEYRIYLFKITSSPDVFLIPLNEKWKSISDIQYLTGWYKPERWNNISTRWMSRTALLLYVSENYENRTLNLDAFSFQSPQTLHVLNPDKVIAHSMVSPMRFSRIQVPVSLQKGVNIIRLVVPEGCDRPLDFPEKNSNDPRCLSLAIQNVTLS